MRNERRPGLRVFSAPALASRDDVRLLRLRTPSVGYTQCIYPTSGLAFPIPAPAVTAAQGSHSQLEMAETASSGYVPTAVVTLSRICQRLPFSGVYQISGLHKCCLEANLVHALARLKSAESGVLADKRMAKAESLARLCLRLPRKLKCTRPSWATESRLT